MKRISPLVLIASLSLFMYSCVEDTWTSGTLDYTFNPKTDPNGYFEGRAILYTKDIALDSYASFINYFNMKRSQVVISGNFYAGDVIDGLEVDVDGAGVYRLASPVYITSSNANKEITIIDSYVDPTFDNFMYKAFSQMSTTGKHDVIVSGYVVNRNNSPVVNCQVYVDVYNDLDVNVRE